MMYDPRSGKERSCILEIAIRTATAVTTIVRGTGRYSAVCVSYGCSGGGQYR
jgi:hypothetical protein